MAFYWSRLFCRANPTAMLCFCMGQTLFDGMHTIGLGATETNSPVHICCLRGRGQIEHIDRSMSYMPHVFYRRGRYWYSFCLSNTNRSSYYIQSTVSLALSTCLFLLHVKLCPELQYTQEVPVRRPSTTHPSRSHFACPFS